jgi:hypothetical protein
MQRSSRLSNSGPTNEPRFNLKLQAPSLKLNVQLSHLTSSTIQIPVSLFKATKKSTMSGGISDVLTNETLPKTEATITIRVIKSFEYRTERSLVLHKLNLETTTVGELKEIARQGMLQSLAAFSLHPDFSPPTQLSRLDLRGGPIAMPF